MTTINKVILKGGRNPGTYDIGGSGSGQPGPSSVGSREIEDGSVGKVDLDEEVNEGLDELNNISLTDEDLEDIFKNGQTEETQESANGGGTDTSGD